MKNTIYLFYVVSVLCSTTTAMAQINTDLRPQVKSPEVNKFEQYMNTPVNLVSGTPQVSIPIYTLEYGGMSLPISLEYDASGVKVESIASSLGQNWSLNVGGVVSLNLKGAVDEGAVSASTKSLIEINEYYKDYGLTKLDLLLNNFPNSAPLNARYSQFNWWLDDVNAGKKVAQPDLFYFSTPEGGVPVTIIWGYNKTQPIAKIENATYSSITSYVSNLETLSNSGTETALIASLNQLRIALSTAMVTTYTHIPQVGVSSITDPKGQTVYYKYDSPGRLENIKDAQGNVLGENEYHYKNPSNQSTLEIQ